MQERGQREGLVAILNGGIIVVVRTKLPIPEPQWNTPMERLDWAFRKVLNVPKAVLKEREQAKHSPRKKAEKRD